MNKEMLTLWYLNNYRDDIKEALVFNKEYAFDFLKLKVNICDNTNNYQHYLKLSNFNRAVLYGSMGSGKTYVLESILKNILFRSKKHCMYFDLKEYNGEDIFDLISKQLKYKNVSKEKIQELMNAKNMSFIFDNYHLLSSDNRKRIKSKIFNNDELINFKFIVSSTEIIDDVNFNEEYTIKSLSVKKALKKVLMSFCKDHYEFKKVKNYINKNALQCFLYKPVNLKYLIKVAEWKDDISFIYNLRCERDLYKKYLEALVGNKEILNAYFYIAYYMMRETDGKIKSRCLEDLIAEALRNFSISKNPDEVLKNLEETIMIKCSIENDVYVFEDENLKMYLIDQYIAQNKIKIKDIILNRKFEKYVKWMCSIDVEFTCKNIDDLSDEFIRNMLFEIEDKKVDEFYEYIIEDKVHDDFMDKLNI